MSKGRKPRCLLHERPRRQPDQSSFHKTRTGLLPTTALAIVVSAVFFWQVLDPRSMLGAIRRAEYVKLVRDEPGDDNSAPAGRPTWDQIADERDNALRQLPDMPAHFAVAQLLRLVIEVDRGKAETPAASQHAAEQARKDPANLLARLAHAVVADMDHASSGDDVAPLDRFEAIRQIIDAAPLARRSTLYNAEFTRVWQQVLGRHVKRTDAAVTLAEAAPHYLITEHYVVLPIIQRRLAALATELRSNGQTEAADTCLRWIARMTLGLMDTETEAGTRLLCTDLLAEILDFQRGLTPATQSEPASVKPVQPVGENLPRQRRSAPSVLQSPTGADPRRLRSDFLAHAAAAPIDLCDQSFSPRPAINGAAYNTAFGSLAFAGVLFLGGLGAALLFVALCLVWTFQAIFRRRTSALPQSRLRVGPASGPPRAVHSVLTDPKNQLRPTTSLTPATSTTYPFWRRLVAGLLPTAVLAILVVDRLITQGLFSQAWGLTMAVVAPTLGALTASAVASLAGRHVYPNVWHRRPGGDSTGNTPAPEGPRQTPTRSEVVTKPGAGRSRSLGLAFLAVASALVIVPVILPPSIVTRWYRQLDLTIVAAPVLAMVAACLVLVTVILSPARLRSIVVAAAFAWCVNACAACLVYQCHRLADAKYQQSAITGRTDEIAARLGADWQDKYLASTRQAFPDR